MPSRRWPHAARLFGWFGGALLLASYAIATAALPRGPAEFAYAPDLFAPLPFAAMRGFTVEQLASHALRLLLLGPAILLVWWATLPPTRRARSNLPGSPPGGPAIWTAAPLLLCFGWWLWLDGRAIFDDELTYRMQGELLAAGRLAEDRLPRWGHEAFTVWTTRGATGKYLFGEPLIQAAGVLLGEPTLLHVPLAALTLWAWGAAVRSRAGDATANWSILLVAWSPLFLFTTATGLSHAAALAALAFAAFGYERLRCGHSLVGALLLGASLGFLLAVRPHVAVAVGSVLGGAVLLQSWRARRASPPVALLAAFLPWVAAIAGYNSALTGSPLTLPWDLYHPVELYGFGQVIEGNDYWHGPRQAIENLAVSTLRFNGWWLGWPLSLALLLLPGARGAGRGGLGPWPLVAAALVAVQIPYYSPGVSDTGPVYYYEMLLPASLAGGYAIAAALERWGQRAFSLLAACFVLGTGSFLVEQGARLHRLVDLLHGQAAMIMDAVEPPALLLYETAPQESIHLGWLFSFPIRERSLDAPVLTFPRGTPRQAAALRRAFPGRTCWYYRVDPSRLAPQLLLCDRAEELLARPRPLPGRPLFVTSTARRLGWIAR